MVPANPVVAAADASFSILWLFFAPRDFLKTKFPVLILAWPRLCKKTHGRNSWQLAEELKPLMMGLDKDIPVITSHSLVGMTAVACGFK